jgi:putative DNA primase/helicase
MHSEYDRIREALPFIDAHDRDVWIKIGMAIHSGIGANGFELWNDWSQSAENYNAGDARTVWRGFKPNGSTGLGTLFHEAKANGWRDDGQYQRPTPEELAERQRKATERAEKDRADVERSKAETAAMAKAILKASTPAPADNPYLLRKQVTTVTTLREIEASTAAELLGYAPQGNGESLIGRLLVVPIKKDGNLSSVELIDGSGRKTALKGRETKAGGYWATGKLSDDAGKELTLLIGEGVATVLSVSEATGHPAVAALSSGNLLAVAKAMREQFPNAVLVILADLVKATGQPDPHAIEAAKQTRARLAIPDFGSDREPDHTDFNDLAALRGVEAVASAIEGALGIPSPAPDYLPAVHLIRACDVTPEPVDWLWPGWLAAGKLHVFGGAPGTGKTTISMALAATVTTGGCWPDGARSVAGNVVIWSGEDDPKDTLVPRLMLSGADLNRVYFIDEIRDCGERRAFDPARDMEPLRRKLAEIGGVRLLIVDPIVSAITGDSHKNAEVRRGLQPLVDLAASMRCALLGITHFSKGTGGRDPVERLTGSLAFGALARVVLVAAKHQEEGEEGRAMRLFCRAKSNIGPDDGGFHYDLHQGELPKHPGILASTVLWGDAVEGAARELLATADAGSDDAEGGSLADAKRFLVDLLAGEPVPAKVVKADSDGAGYAWRTIQRAQKILGIKPRKDGMKGGWMWEMPSPEAAKNAKNTEDDQQNLLAPFHKSGALRDQTGLVEVEL